VASEQVGAALVFFTAGLPGLASPLELEGGAKRLAGGGGQGHAIRSLLISEVVNTIVIDLATAR
jgi:hypothetical protein